MRRALIAFALAALCIASARAADPTPVDQRAVLAAQPPQTLAAYHFFQDAGARTPNAGVTPYDLNTTLWSDGALKFRYLYLPPGAKAAYREDGVFDLPVGAVLIKTFAFAADMRHPEQNVRFLETRLLIHKASGWVALPYVWNDAQTEARLSPIGATMPIDFTGEDGAATHLDWAVPNVNQCKGCHDHAGAIVPIGPTAANLNLVSSIIIHTGGPAGHFPSGETQINQLDEWSDEGILAGAPRSTDIPHFARADDPTSGTLDERARAYLQVNCAHCHNPDGPAHTSGLDLRYAQTDPAQWGVLKRPVAAGRGGSNLDFDIVPGHPEQSIIPYRMNSANPGEMMPELGRSVTDQRAVSLIRDWIAHMGPDGKPDGRPHS